MTDWIWSIIAVVMVAFAFVVLFGPPYLPTRRRYSKTALDLLALEPGQTMLELGSGDGRVLLAAAKRGWNVVGIELNPLLVLFSKIYTWRYRRQVHIIWGDYFKVKWPPVEGIFTFMLPRLMSKLDHHVTAWPHRPVKLASFAFKIPNKKPSAKRNGVFLYTYK